MIHRRANAVFSILFHRAVWLALALCLSTSASHALDIVPGNPFPDGPNAGVARVITLQGEIVTGDTDKFVQWLRSHPADAWHGTGRVDLRIAGGSQREALQLADMLVNLYPHVAAGADCSGACAIVWLAGAWRTLPRGKIGLEKPAPTPPPFASSTALDAPPAYDPLLDQLRAYYVKQGLQPLLADQTLAGRSSQVYWLSDRDINSTGVWPPYYFEKLRANCPLLLHNNEAFHALRRCAAGLVISQKAFAFDRLMQGASHPWWNENRDVFKSAPR